MSEIIDLWKKKELDLLKKIKNSKEKRYIEEISILRKIENEEILKKKNLLLYLREIPKEILEKRIIMGFLEKKNNQKHFSKFEKFWFLLISCNPLFSNEKKDENIIKECQLPPKIELDTLYYYQYDFEGDTSGVKGSISMNDCLDIYKIDSQVIGKDNSFIMNTKNITIVLAAETELDIDKWIEAIKNSMKNIKEIKKNIQEQNVIDSVLD